MYCMASKVQVLHQACHVENPSDAILAWLIMRIMRPGLSVLRSLQAEVVKRTGV